MVARKRSQAALWTGMVAAASGVAIATAVMRWKHAQNSRHLGVSKRLRDIQSVLSDCHKKINEIETRLPASLLPGLKNGMTIRTHGSTALDPS